MTVLRKLITGLFLAVLAAPLMAGPFAYVNNNTADDPDSNDPADLISGNLVSVLDLATGEIVTDIEVGRGPRSITVDPDRSRVYVGDQLDLSISVIDAETNTVIEELLVDLEAFAIVVNPVNGEIYAAVTDPLVGNSGGVQIFAADLSNAKNPETVTTANQPISLAVTPDGSKLYVGAFAGQSVLVMDVATRSIERVIQLGAFPAGMLASVDGTRIYVSDFVGSKVTVIGTANNTVVDNVAVGAGADDLAQNADGSRLYVGNVVDNTVSVVDTQTLQEIEAIDVGEQPRGVDVAADGTLVVTNSADDTVSIVSDITKTTVTTVNMPVNSTPFSYGSFIIGADSGPTLELDATWSGAWYDATQSGHGFLFQVLPGGVMLVYWFTYDSEGSPTWFFGVGEIDGNKVEFDLFWEPDGPSFPPDFDPADFVPVPWGTLVIVFFDCNTGMAAWDSKFEEFGAGEMDLERITSTDTLDCEDDDAHKGLPAVDTGDLLGTTGFAGGLLLDIDPITGAGETRFAVGDFGPVTEVEFRDDGVLFATGGGLDGAGGTGSLSIIDPDTGEETLVGSDPPGATAGLEFVGDVLYGSHTLAQGADSTLVIVDQSNGVLNEIGDIGFNTVAGLAYDGKTDALFGSDVDGNLITVDTATGAGTLVGNTGFTFVTALEFGPDGTLYGGLGTQDPDAGSLITINPATGAGALVGPTGFLGLSGLAFVPGASFTITAAFSGAWYDATQSGHGFLFQVLPGGVMLVYWFTYDSEGNPTWFFGVGEIDGNKVEFDLFWEPDGPSFPPDFDPADFVPVPWGTLVIVFFDCNTGMAEWDSKFEEFGAGEMDLERITATDTLDCEI